jgi:hypothetical protein
MTAVLDSPTPHKITSRRAIIQNLLRLKARDFTTIFLYNIGILLSRQKAGGSLKKSLIKIAFKVSD